MKLYAVKDDKGQLCVWQLGYHENYAIDKFLHRANGIGEHHTWREFMDKGYTVVPVSIQEVKK
jgi:hypothetical protein